MEKRQCPPSLEKALDIDSYVERLLPVEKIDLVRLIKTEAILDSFSRTEEGKKSYFLFYAWTDESERGGSIEYNEFGKPTGFSTFGDPITIPEVYAKLRRNGYKVDKFLKAAGDYLPFSYKIPQKEDVTEEELRGLPETLRANYQKTTKSCIQKLRQESNYSINYLEKRVRDLSQLALVSLDEEELRQAVISCHRNNLIYNLRQVKELEEKGVDFSLIMLHVDSAVEAARFLGEDLAFAKDYAGKALVQEIEEMGQLVGEVRKGFFVDRTIFQHFQFLLTQAVSHAEITETHQETLEFYKKYLDDFSTRIVDDKF